MGEIIDLDSYRSEKLKRQREERRRRQRQRGPAPEAGQLGERAEADPAKDEPV